MNLMSKNDFFDDAFGLLDSSFFKNSNNIMKTDISVKDGNYIIEIDVPGLRKEDITIDYDNGYVTISASKEEKKEEDGKYIRRERYYGEYKRSFYVGDVNENDIKANYNDGTLTITLPKEEPKETKKQILIDW